MQALKAYCFECRDSRVVRQAKEIALSGGARALRGSCASCRQELFKVDKMAKAHRGEAVWLYLLGVSSMAFMAGYYLVKIGLMS